MDTKRGLLKWYFVPCANVSDLPQILVPEVADSDSEELIGSDEVSSQFPISLSNLQN